jgi:hypothetical protein
MDKQVYCVCPFAVLSEKTKGGMLALQTLRQKKQNKKLYPYFLVRKNLSFFVVV